MKATTQRSLLAIISAALVVIVWLLLESRPPLPTTTELTSTSNLDRLLGCLAWLGSLLLTLGLLTRIIGRRSRAAPERSAPIRSLRPRSQAVRPPRVGGYASRAFPLILRPQPDNDDARSDPPAPEPAGREPSPPARHDEPFPEDDEPIAGTAQVCILVLGQLLIEGGRRHGRKLRGPSRDLLAYLALHRNGAHRDQLTDELWPDQSPEHARSRLYRAAADVRSHFGDAILIRNGDHYQLNRAHVRVDLDDLEHHQAVLAQTQSADQELSRLEAALALFRGEPLEGSDLPWAENEQRRLHALRLELLERAGRNRLSRGDASGALTDAEAGLAQEPYNENLARVAMQAEAALGLRTALISRYEKLRELLERELGLQPHRETRALYRALLGQDPPAQASPQSSRGVESTRVA